MERGLHRFMVGMLVGVFTLAGTVRAQQADSYLPVDQLTAVMMGEDEAASPPPSAVEEVDPTQSKPYLGILEGIQARGSINIGYAFNFNDAETGGGVPDPADPTTKIPAQETPFRIFDIYHNEFTVHNAILYLEKPVDNDNLIGFAFTPSVGKDSAGTQGGNISFGGDDLDVLQLNIRIYTPDDIGVLGGTKFEIGKFLTSAGGEVIDAPYNDMFSRTWLFGLAIPFTHTGVRATRTLLTHEDESSLVDLSLGIANGWDNHEVGSLDPGTGSSNGNFPTWLNTLFFNFGGPMKALLTINDFVGETTTSGSYRNLLDIIGKVTVVENLTLSGNFDWITDEAGNVATGGYGELYGFAGIVRYDFGVMSDVTKWYVAMRGEYVDDRDGFAFGVTGVDVYELTWTIGYRPVNSLLLRTELRYDKADTSVFENGDSNNQTTLSFDVSLLF